MWSQRGHRVIANVPLYNWKQYAFILIVAGGRDIVQRREERIFAHHNAVSHNRAKLSHLKDA